MHIMLSTAIIFTNKRTVYRYPFEGYIHFFTNAKSYAQRTYRLFVPMNTGQIFRNSFNYYVLHNAY